MRKQLKARVSVLAYLFARGAATRIVTEVSWCGCCAGLPDVQCSWAALSATLSPDDQLCDHTHPEFPQEPCDVCRSHATSHACTFTGGLRLAEILRTDRVKLPDHCCFLCAVMKGQQLPAVHAPVICMCLAT